MRSEQQFPIGTKVIAARAYKNGPLPGDIEQRQEAGIATRIEWNKLCKCFLIEVTFSDGVKRGPYTYRSAVVA